MTWSSKRHISRRRVVATSAWVAPAVVMATSSPAFAVTTGANALVFEPGASRTVETDGGGVIWHDFEFVGAEVYVDGQPAPGAVLTLTVTFTNYPTSPQMQSSLYVAGTPAGWTSSQVDTSQQAVVYTWASGTPAPGQRIAILA